MHETTVTPLTAPPLTKPPRYWPFHGTYYGWAIVWTGFLVSFVHVPMYGPVFGVFIKPIGDDLGWSRTSITIAFTIGSLGGALLSAAIGSTLDKHGARIAVAVAGMVVGGALFGVAAMTQPWHFWLFYGVGRSVAVAGIGVGTSVAIANWFVRKRGRAIAIKAAGQRGGQSLMPLVILPVLLILGWRQSFVVLGFLALVFIILPGLLFIRRRPEDMGLLPDGGPDLRDAAGAGEAPPEMEHSWVLGDVRRTRTLWLMVAAMSAGIAAQFAVNVHVVANFEDKGISQGLAVTILSLFTGIAAVTMLPWGLLMERVHVRIGAMICMAIYIASMGLLVVADTYAMAMLFAVVFGIGTGGWTVAQMLMVPNYFGSRHAGSIKGFVSPIEGAIGLTGPLAAAYVHDRVGTYDPAFLAFAGLFAFAFVAFWLARPLRLPLEATAGSAS